MKIAILSNVNLDMLIDEAARSNEVFRTEGYGQWISYALKKDEVLEAFAPKIIYLIIDGNALLETCPDFESGQAELEQSFAFISRLAENYPFSTIAVSDIDIRPDRISPQSSPDICLALEYEWSRRLTSLAENPRIVPFKLRTLIAREGRKNIYSEKLWYTGSIPYGIKSLKPFANAINELAEHISSVRKKVLILDLDNTLWGGVAGEDGPQGITLGSSLIGAAYRDAQKRIKEIKDSGILLAVVSKNNPEDALAVFRENTHMVLKEQDFISMKLNWEPKYVNIAALAKELNLGLDSFVFLDDNEVEREAVKNSLPEVNVPDFPNDIAALPQTVSAIFNRYFWCASVTDEDRKKTGQYVQEVQRKQAMSAAVSMDEYLKSLEMNITVGPVLPEQYERTVQLMNKTNQFNTNTVRMDMQSFLQTVADESRRIYTVNVSDRYGDSGLVSLVLTSREADCLRIDNFLMSCRVMGRQIENSIVAAIAEQAAEDGLACIKASYAPTPKNKPVENLWDRLGFEILTADENEKQYCLKLPMVTKPLIGAVRR